MLLLVLAATCQEVEKMSEGEEAEIDIAVEDTSIDKVEYIAEWKLHIIKLIFNSTM